MAKRRLEPVAATAGERRELEVLARSRSRIEADRARIILLTLDQWPVAEIAEAIGCCEGHVRNMRVRFRDGGASALVERPRGGSVGVVGPAAIAIAERIIAETGETAWNAVRLRAEIVRRGGPAISISQLRRELKKGSHIVGRATRSRRGKMWMRADGLVGSCAA
jgi:Homeodomain-like domain